MQSSSSHTHTHLHVARLRLTLWNTSSKHHVFAKLSTFLDFVAEMILSRTFNCATIEQPEVSRHFVLCTEIYITHQLLWSSVICTQTSIWVLAVDSLHKGSSTPFPSGVS